MLIDARLIPTRTFSLRIVVGTTTVAVVSPTPQYAAQLAQILRGPPGPPGPGVDTYEHDYSSALSWTVNHGLGRKPNIQVMTPGGVEITAYIVHIDLNQAVVNFAVAQAGHVRCL